MHYGDMGAIYSSQPGLVVPARSASHPMARLGCARPGVGCPGLGQVGEQAYLGGWWGDLWGDVKDWGAEWWEETKQSASDLVDPSNYLPAPRPPDARPAPTYVAPTTPAPPAGAGGAGFDTKTLLMLGGGAVALWLLLK